MGEPTFLDAIPECGVENSTVQQNGLSSAPCFGVFGDPDVHHMSMSPARRADSDIRHGRLATAQSPARTYRLHPDRSPSRPAGIFDGRRAANRPGSHQSSWDKSVQPGKTGRHGMPGDCRDKPVGS